jgi:predicted phosphohydrolase
MMIQYVSDLHLEFPQNAEYLRTNPIQPKAEVLILAGDIIPFQFMNQHKWFFRYVSENFKKTYWLPGNHEYFHADAAYRTGTVHERIRNNVFLVNNTSARLAGVHLIFSTLWSRIGPATDYLLEANVSDFSHIRYQGKRFSARAFNQLHDECLAFVRQEVAENPADKTVVATHHVPTLLHYPEQYRGSALNEAFAVELYDFIESAPIDYWLFGHHHYNGPAFAIGGTQLVTNQLGYVHQGEHRGFDPAKVIEV